MVVLQHAPAEGPARIGALEAGGCALHIWQAHAGRPVPTCGPGLDALVIMGGPQSAFDDAGFATRRAELALISEAVKRGMPVLGVCLGPQLLAHVAADRRGLIRLSSSSTSTRRCRAEGPHEWPYGPTTSRWVCPWPR